MMGAILASFPSAMCPRSCVVELLLDICAGRAVRKGEDDAAEASRAGSSRVLLQNFLVWRKARYDTPTSESNTRTITPSLTSSIYALTQAIKHTHRHTHSVFKSSGQRDIINAPHTAKNYNCLEILA